MLKGQVFANQLFENQIFALFVNTFTNGKNGVSNNYKNGMAITYSGSDVTIDSGAVLIQGRFLEEDTSTTISAGADNMYCKLVVEIDLDKTNTTTEFNQGYYKIVKGANAYPTLTQTNIVKNVSGVYQYELARFRTTTSGITDFQDKRTFIDFDSIYDEIEAHIDALENESNLVFKTGSTMTGTLVAEGGVAGDLTGNATTSTTASACSGNSATATKLQTARTINGTSFNGTANITTSKWGTARTLALTGAVSGSQSVDGSGNISITTTQNNIAVITGSATADATTSSTIAYATKDISYPSGYTKSNSIVIAFGLEALNSAQGYNYGACLGRSGIISGTSDYAMIGGAGDMAVRGNFRNINLRDNDIRIRIQNVADTSQTFNYKIVLMKVS